MVDTELKSLWDRAIALHGEGRYAEALECMRTVEASLPDNLAVLSGMGVAYRDSGDLFQASNTCAVLAPRVRTIPRRTSTSP